MSRRWSTAGRLAAPAVVLLATLLPARAPAQQVRRPAARDQYEITAKLSEAMRLLASEPDNAVTLLRGLNARFPNQERILTRLGYAMQVTGKSDSAVVYYRKALTVDPASLDAGKQLGLIYLNQGNQSKAMGVFDDIIRRNQGSMGAYRAVGQALADAGRYDQALTIYEQGRDANPRNDVLSLDIAALHQTMGEPAAALDEYLKYIGDRGRNYQYAKGQVLQLIRDAKPDDAKRLTQSLEQKLAAGKGNRFVLLDILASRYLEEGLLEQALARALDADKVGGGDGRVLLSLAQRILAQVEAKPREKKRRYLDLGIRALDAFARDHPQAPGTDRAKYMLAQIYRRLGTQALPGMTRADRVNFLQQAVAEYADLSRRYPNSEFAERAYLERGDVLLYHLGRPNDALEAYKSGAVNSRHMADDFASRIAEVYLGTSRWKDAQHYFNGLTHSGIPELIQAGQYYGGLGMCLQGQYEAARDTLTHFAESDPSSRYTNDAIATAWVVQQGLQYGSKALGSWFQSRQAKMVGDTTAVVASLRKIVDEPVYETLRPRALYDLGTTLYGMGDYDKAIALLREFLKEYPDEDLRPDVQRTIGEIYEKGYEQYDRALREYEEVLMTYPDYAFLDEVRKDVRRLRYVVKGEEYED